MTILLESFGAYVSAGDRITAEHDGFTVVATLHEDDCQDPPWEREDGHGPVAVTKRPREGQWPLSIATRTYYDYKAALAKAKDECWGESEDAQAAAVEADYRALRAYCNDEWRYYGVAVTVSKAGVQLTGNYAHAVWGIEGNYPGGDNSYLAVVANELAEEALAAAKDTLKALCECEGVDHV